MSPIVIILIPILFFSVVLHECAHGIAAYRCGDDTAKLMGRITLNPIPHIDLFGTIILPLFAIISRIPLIAWAKPVPVNPLNFRKPRRDDIIVSSAGILTNILVAITAGLFLIVFSNFYIIPNKIRAGLTLFFSLVIIINLWLASFNLIPIPPLDGSHILANILPYSLSRVYRQINPILGIILLLLIIRSSLFGYIFNFIQEFTSMFIQAVTPASVIAELNKFKL